MQYRSSYHNQYSKEKRARCHGAHSTINGYCNSLQAQQDEAAARRAQRATPQTVFKTAATSYVTVQH